MRNALCPGRGSATSARPRHPPRFLRALRLRRTWPETCRAPQRAASTIDRMLLRRPWSMSIIRHRETRSTTCSSASPMASCRPCHVSSTNGSLVSITMLTRNRRASASNPHLFAHQFSVAVPMREMAPMSLCGTSCSGRTWTGVHIEAPARHPSAGRRPSIHSLGPRRSRRRRAYERRSRRLGRGGGIVWCSCQMRSVRLRLGRRTTGHLSCRAHRDRRCRGPLRP